MLTGANGCCLFILTTLLSGLTPAAAQHPQWLSARCDRLSSPTPRIQRLGDWLDALERHEAGRIDEPAGRVHGWPADALAQVQVDLRSLVIVIRSPDTTTFYSDPNPGRTDPLRRSPIAYSGAERTALRALACTLARRTTPNRLLMRGALLHTDIAVAASRLPRSGRSDRPRGRFSSVPAHLTVSMYEFEDGEMVGEFQVLSHWACSSRARQARSADRTRRAPPTSGQPHCFRAQTPYLGLSELAHQDGDSAGALTRLRSVLGNPADAPAREDPWWSYESSAGRDAEALLRAVYARFPASLDRD